MTEGEATPSAYEPNPIHEHAQQLVNVMLQGNPSHVVACISYLRSTFDQRIVALILDTAGKQIGAAQQAWLVAANNWRLALQTQGLSEERLRAQVQQILKASAEGHEGTSA